MSKKQGHTKKERPEIITLEPLGRRYLRKWKDGRSMTQCEHDIVAGIAFALDVDNRKYTYDDKKTAFVRIQK
jgi:hypothetical protein